MGRYPHPSVRQGEERDESADNYAQRAAPAPADGPRGRGVARVTQGNGSLTLALGRNARGDFLWRGLSREWVGIIISVGGEGED